MNPENNKYKFWDSLVKIGAVPQRHILPKPLNRNPVRGTSPENLNK